MPRKAQYILLFLLCLVLYEVYLIVYHRWQDYQIDTYIRTIESDTERLRTNLESNKDRLAMVQTNAWIDKTIKKTQNRKNPGEEVFLLIANSELAGESEPATPPMSENTPTSGMEPYQKWIYYGFGVNLLER